ADTHDLPLATGVVGPFATTGPGTLRPGDPAWSVDNQTVSADPSGGRGFAGRVVSNRAGKVFLWVGPQVHVTDSEADVTAVEALAESALAFAGAAHANVPVT